jgi:hypothetical protein
MFGLSTFADSVICGISPPVLLQIAIPISDVSSTIWLPKSGSSLYEMFSSSAPEGSHVYSLQSGQFIVALTDTLENPLSVLNHKITWSGIGSYTLYLMNGTTTIASWTKNDGYVSKVDHLEVLTQLQVESITDYTNLRIKVVS